MLHKLCGHQKALKVLLNSIVQNGTLFLRTFEVQYCQFDFKLMTFYTDKLSVAVNWALYHGPDLGIDAFFCYCPQ